MASTGTKGVALPPVEVVERRAKIAGIAGWTVFAVGILGFALLPELRYLWIFLGFAGLGGILRGVVLMTAAFRQKLGRRS